MVIFADTRHRFLAIDALYSPQLRSKDDRSAKSLRPGRAYPDLAAHIQRHTRAQRVFYIAHRNIKADKNAYPERISQTDFAREH